MLSTTRPYTSTVAPPATGEKRVQSMASGVSAAPVWRGRVPIRLLPDQHRIRHRASTVQKGRSVITTTNSNPNGPHAGPELFSHTTTERSGTAVMSPATDHRATYETLFREPTAPEPRPASA
jgi:hypothetical protein